MLVVHPASCCDVCLDPYSISSEPANSPHAIACGHIFCLTCLRSLSPSACPLCRKAFQPDRVKKLHLANPPELDNAEQDAIDAHASLLLQRIALVSGEDTPEADVVEVVTEVQEWLQFQPDDPNSHMALRAAVASLQRYKALQDQSEREKLEYRRLRSQLRNNKRNADHDSKTSRAVEESLLSRIQEIENDHALELSQLHSELENLRNPQSRYRNNGNPLPPPPEPLPIDRFPTFARPGGGLDSLLGGAVPYPAPPPRDNTTHVNGDAHASGSKGTTSIHKPVSHPPKPQPVPNTRPPEAPRVEEHWTDNTRRPHASSIHSRAPEPQPKINITTRGAHIPPNAIRINPSPTWAARPLVVEDRRSDDERELRRKERNSISVSVDVANDVSTRLASAAAYISGYGSGYESGYQLISAPYVSSTGGNERAFPLLETQSPEQVTDALGLMGSSGEDHMTPVPRARPVPRRAVTEAAQVDNVSRSLSDVSLLGTPAPENGMRRRATVQNVGQAIRVDNISRGLSDVPLLGTPPPDNGVGRRAAVQTVGQMLGLDIGLSLSNGNAVAGSLRLDDSAAGFARLNDGAPSRPVDAQIRMPRPRALIPPLDPSPDAESPRSATTWGTLSTSRAGSMDHLGLLGLHNGGVRGQGSVAGESIIGRLESDEDTTDDDGEDISVTPVIPMPTAGPDALGLILEDGGEADYIARDEEWRYRAQSSYAASRTSYPSNRTSFPPSHTSHPPNHNNNSRPSNRTSHSQSSRTQRAQYGRHTSQPRGYEEGTTTRVPSGSTSYTNTNALSLHFDASLAMHDHAIRPFTGAGSGSFTSAGHGPSTNTGHGSFTSGGHGPFSNTGNVDGPQIVAPTPIVGGPNIAHMWANRT
ncbi:hypothetical protein DEU56DRAFT_566103 [Suillus clintonianus]|uniref:uncharacterized protein n=1 Tax=Suillus clintonianus TaxID=1904413 RepID=UPI001B87300E|nr:uncharacterized protein DEU56DRAFT_566103 [Suillus clintonianus]KAG2125675.1 hypothetical protein DEU56DRAFT_566103 [Suillus clintonianus]